MSRPVRRTLVVLAVLEVLTLAVLLVNLATVHLRPVTQAVGPTHGAVYLAIVAIGWLAPGIRLRERLLGMIPVVGGPLVAWLTARAATPPRGPAPDDPGPRTPPPAPPGRASTP